MVYYCKKFFDLTIGPDYVPNWGLWETVREFIQNGLDGAQDGYALDIHRGSNGTIVIRNKGALLLPKHLILGQTSKGNGEYRGQYGEGFKLGMMSLCRIAKSIGRENAMSIHTGDEVWVPTIHKSEDYGTDIIRVNTFPKKRNGFLTIEIPGVSPKEWLEIQNKILILGRPYEKDNIPGYGELLKDEQHKDSLFCKGLWVSDLPMPSKYGYNLTQITLDRDRKMADECSVKSSVSQILSTLCMEDKISCSEILGLMETERLLETESLRYYGNYTNTWTNFKKKLAQYWKDIYGELAIPVSTPEELATAASLGQVAISTSNSVKQFLSDNVLQLYQVKAEKALEIAKVYKEEELDERERFIVNKSVSLAKKALPNQEFKVQLVDFTMPNISGLCDWNKGLISVNKREACDYMVFTGTLLHELGHLKGDLDQSKGHMDEVTRIAARLLYISNEDVT